MKKIVRLTESDLTRIVKRIISENESAYTDSKEDFQYDIEEIDCDGLEGFKGGHVDIEEDEDGNDIIVIRYCRGNDTSLGRLKNKGERLLYKKYGVNENEDKDDNYPTSLKAAAKLWVKSDKDERRKIKAHILKTGVSPEKFLDAIGDVYESQW
jgi:hypothetical protein